MLIATEPEKADLGTFVNDHGAECRISLLIPNTVCFSSLSDWSGHQAKRDLEFVPNPFYIAPIAAGT